MGRRTGRLQGRVALVTGAASGIGAATVQRLADDGARVLATDIDVDQGQARADALGDTVTFARHDVTDPDDWAATVAALQQRHGRLDIVVHNAGGGVTGDFERTTLAQWRAVQALNVESVLLGTQAALPLMRRSGDGGAIVIVSSVAALLGVPEFAAYGAAKAAVAQFSKTVALQCARRGDKIRCNCVHPSFTDTPMVAALAAQASDPTAAQQRLEAAAPLGRLARADEVASLIAYLVGDEAAFITGASLPVDGGLTAR